MSKYLFHYILQELLNNYLFVLIIIVSLVSICDSNIKYCLIIVYGIVRTDLLKSHICTVRGANLN